MNQLDDAKYYVADLIFWLMDAPRFCNLVGEWLEGKG